MKEFDFYFNFDSILRQIIKHRVRLAFSTNKSTFYNKFAKNKIDENPVYSFWRTILPPRNQWVKISKLGREKHKSALKRNEVALFSQVKLIQRKVDLGKVNRSDFIWFENLENYIDEIITKVNYSYLVSKPKIIAELKDKLDKSNIQRRPLCNYILQDKIVLSIVNKYLCNFFDDEFLPCSYAFRGKSNETHKIPNHHDAVTLLKEFRIQNNGALYVSECDIQKFFDTVDHSILIKLFEEHKSKIEIEKSIKLNQKAEQILISYLESYSFNYDVFPKNDKLTNDYFKDLKDYKGYFPWIKELESEFKNTSSERKVGIPQGGALFGLMVNILLHYSDKIIFNSEKFNLDYLYLRYCDDMIIISNSKILNEELFDLYTSSLGELKLYFHPDKNLKTYSKDFWEAKTKKLFVWDNQISNEMLHSRWISFVGYQINYLGELRVRKKSLQKEMLKHSIEFNKVSKLLRKNKPENITKSYTEIVKSVESRLCSMGVGKVNITNYQNTKFEMCWAKGFCLLEDNKYIRHQLRILDKSRKEALFKIKATLHKNGIRRPEIGEVLEFDDSITKTKKFKTKYYHYPFSYSSILKRL